jgi:predicted secreted protein
MRTGVAAPAVAAVLALLAGCGGGGAKVYENPHGTIGVKKGDEFTLQLVVNSGVGYDWQLIPFDIDSPKLQLLKTQTVYPSEDRAGESGKKRFRFRATRIGRQVLIFQHYFRSSPTDRRVLRIDVKPAS